MKKIIGIMFTLVLTFLSVTEVEAMELLPQTGESSSWVLILIAVIAVLVGIWLVVTSRKKK